jgi:hypothetical protein
MSQIGARSAYLALRDFDPANVSCGSWLRENAETEFANGNFVSTSINLETKALATVAGTRQ